VRRSTDRGAPSGDRGSTRANVNSHGAGARDSARAAVVGAMGLAFGGIGTSPIYTIQTVLSPGPHPVAVSTDSVFGVRDTVLAR
jgi:KUP system potassium uptake protein